MSREGFQLDMPTRLDMMGSGALAISDIDSKRRVAVMRRRPDKFAGLRKDEVQNFVVYGIAHRDGELDSWLQRHEAWQQGQSARSLGSHNVFLLDHFPRRAIGFPPVEVHWTGATYLGKVGQFHDYPALMGFDMHDLERGEFGDHELSEGTAFLQSWLFFGLLREAFAESSEIVYRYWIADFERHEPVRKRMHSPELPKYLDTIRQTWTEKRTSIPWESWEAIFKTTWQVAEAFDQRYEGRSDAASVEMLQVVWSILNLGQLIVMVVSQAYGIESHFIKEWPDSSLVKDALAARGMCPNVVNRIMATLSMDSLYIFSLLPWYEPEVPWVPRYRDHNPAVYKATIGRHQECGFQECVYSTIDYDLYQTAHVLDGCACTFLGPDIDDIYTILEADLIPVINVSIGLDENGCAHPLMSVVPSTAVEQYVAISHVWADGLGNDLFNELPLCQVYRIASLVNELVGSPCPFWIDALCVPRNLEKRKLALNLMNATYKQSTFTLVLDASLLSFKSGKSISRFLNEIDVEFAERVKVASAVEATLRIFACPWTTRLWTLPEAQVPPELYFQFFDGQIDLNDLINQMKTWPFIGTNLISDLRSFLVRLRPKVRTQDSATGNAEDPALLGWPNGQLDGRFIAMLHAIEFRTTSRKTDEVLCMAIQLNLNVANIMQRDVDRQLQALLTEVEKVPADLIFTHGPRLMHSPFRWAPAHLLDYKSNFSFVPGAVARTPMGTVTERGLRISYPCFQFQVGELPSSMSLDLILIPINSEGRIDGNPRRAFSMMVHPGPSELPSNSINWDRSALSLWDANEVVRVVVGGEHIPAPALAIAQGRVGLLVKQKSFEGGIVYAAPLETVVIFEKPLPESPDLVDWSTCRQGVIQPHTPLCIG